MHLIHQEMENRNPVKETDWCSNHSMIQSGVAKNIQLLGCGDLSVSPGNLSLILQNLDILDEFGDEKNESSTS